MKTIFVAETVPSQNKGEAALMHGIVRSIQYYSDEEVQFYLCSDQKDLDQKEYGEGVKVINSKGLIPLDNTPLMKLMNFSVDAFKHLIFLILYKLTGSLSLKIFKGELWEAYYNADAIIVGHDNAFCKFHVPLMLYCKMLGKKTSVYGATIMPVVLNSKLMHKLGMYALNKMDLITTREELTYNHLKDIGVNKAPLYCTADKAFILQPVPEDESSKLIEKLGLNDLPRPLIGVMVVKGSTVFKAAFKGNTYTPEEKYNKHCEEIAKTLDNVHNEIGGTFVFVPHCIGPGDNLDDRICADSVLEHMSNKDCVKILRDELRVTELKGMMSAFDMVVSERTHGGINAASMLIPTLWITHPKDHRTYGIVQSTLNLPECIYNIEDLESSALTSKILETYKGKDAIIEKLKQHIPEAQAKTMKNGEYFKKYML
ncbi:MAG: polysaccharide pyruvyl transferase family protein [Gammaproteobacteria bacterium]|nr:polysaccharide pyruvyl transferase family protein [Gammaproteobacteria bacterium]